MSVFKKWSKGRTDRNFWLVSAPSPLLALSLSLSSGDIISRFDPQTEVSADRTDTFGPPVFPSVLPAEYKTKVEGSTGRDMSGHSSSSSRCLCVTSGLQVVLSVPKTDMQVC